MKRNYKIQFTLFFFVIISTNTIYAQAPDFIWAKTAGGNDKEAGLSVATDANGNIIVTGAFSSDSIVFGSLVLHNTQSGNFDLFLVKYSASGNPLWAKNAGGIDVGGGLSVATDRNSNIFVTGTFITSTISFDTITLTNSNSGSLDMFIAKYNEDGNAIWANNAEGVSEARSIATDKDGNAFVTGSFYSVTTNFDIKSVTNIDNTGSTNDIFLVKYNDDGKVQWANSAAGIYEDVAYSVATDTLGNAFVCGYFNSDTMKFDPYYIINAQPGYDYVFLVKYDTDGNALWANGAGGGVDYDDAYSVATDVNGNVFITGRFNSPTITFDTIVLNNNANWWLGDLFLTKYNSAGDVVWAKSTGGSNTDMGWSLTTDASGNIFVTGDFWSSTIIFGSTTLNNTNSRSNVFLTKYDESGNILWAKSTGGIYDDYGVSVATDKSGDLFLTGNYFSPTIDFGLTTLTNSNNTGKYGEMYLTKLEDVVTGISPLNNNENFIVYPNPSNGKFNVECSKFKVEQIEVYNMLGEKIYSCMNANYFSAFELNLSKECNGMYAIIIKTEQETIIGKLILQK